MKNIKTYTGYKAIEEAVPSQEDYHTKDKKDVLFIIDQPHKKAMETSRGIWKDIEKHGMVFDEFFDNDKGNETGKFLISFPAAVNDVSPKGKQEIIKIVGNRAKLIERPKWVNEGRLKNLKGAGSGIKSDIIKKWTSTDDILDDLRSFINAASDAGGEDLVRDIHDALRLMTNYAEGELKK